MSKVKENKIKEKIEEICGILKRVSMTTMSDLVKDNMFNFNKEGDIIMLGFDFVKLKLDAKKMALLGEIIIELTHLEGLFIFNSEVNNFPHWLKDIKKKDLIRNLHLLYSHLNIIPEWLREFNNLEELSLRGNEITILPDWLLTLKKLRRFYIRANPIELNQENLNISRKFKSRKFKYIRLWAHSGIELYLLHNNIPIEHLKLIYEIEKYAPKYGSRMNESYNHIKVKEGKLIEWNLYLKKTNILKSLPENFGIFRNLQKLTINESSIVSLPESIGEIKGLKEINLSNNQLISLPESFENLTSITKLDLSNNKFSEIPTQLWNLKELSELDLNNNPLNPEDMVISKKIPDLIREHLRKKATIRVFISHAVIDFEEYHIEQLVEFLNNQKEISEAYFCEADLAGNIDEWMLDTIPKSQLLLFIATKKSVFDSADCRNELELADKFSIPIVPLKGNDVDWADLAELKLSRELGIEFDKTNFDNFCTDLYEYILNFKQEIDLMSEKGRKKGLTDIYERFRLLLNENLDNMKRKINQLEDRIKKLEE